MVRVRDWIAATWHDFRQSWRLWLMAGLPLVTLTVLAWPFDGEQWLRLSGLTLEFAGVVSIAIGLKKTRQEFHLPSLAQLYREALAAVFRIRRDVNIVTGSASISLGSVSLSARGTVGLAPGATFEQRLAFVESRILQLDDAAHLIRRDLDLETQKSATGLTAEAQVRASADEQLHKKLKDAVAGGIILETAGVVWLVLGLPLSTAPDEILCVWQLIFRLWP